MFPEQVCNINELLIGLAQLVEALCYKPEGQGSIPVEVIGFFNIPNPSSRTMAQESSAYDRNEYQ
jgi:hypothetical protein